LQDPPKFTQIGIFSLKTNHLATLFWTSVWVDAAKCFCKLKRKGTGFDNAALPICVCEHYLNLGRKEFLELWPNRETTMTRFFRIAFRLSRGQSYDF
jgi:hypothetical protein